MLYSRILIYFAYFDDSIDMFSLANGERKCRGKRFMYEFAMHIE